MPQFFRIPLAVICIASLAAVNAAPGSTAADISNIARDPESHGCTNWVAISAGSQGRSQSCECACALLGNLPNIKVTSSNYSTYQPIPYWSAQQQALVPACRVDATSALDISATLQIAKLTQCPFAVRSGGHTAFAGGSSIQNGILLNLGTIAEITLSADRRTTRVGSGNTWGDVYKVLDVQGVSVVGGREAGVRVGGFLLGGGISYFSGRFGWGCDNVINYETILADGSILNVSATAYPDLYKALRGGSGTNFGLVSSFDLATFDQGLLWGGSSFHPISANGSLIDTFHQFVIDAPTDVHAHLYIAFLYLPALGGFRGSSGAAYSLPIANATIFNGLKAIPSLSIVPPPSFANLTTLSIALNQTTFQRELWRTITFHNGAKLMKGIVKFFLEEVAGVIDIVTDLEPACAFQPLSANIVGQMAKNDGNVLGLKASDGPLVIFNVNWGWPNESDDATVYAAVDRFFSRSVALAKSMKVDHRYIYMNYAARDQDVFKSYGTNSLRPLMKVKRTYDPENVFGALQPGYFKLPDS